MYEHFAETVGVTKEFVLNLDGSKRDVEEESGFAESFSEFFETRGADPAYRRKFGAVYHIINRVITELFDWRPAEVRIALGSSGYALSYVPLISRDPEDSKRKYCSDVFNKKSLDLFRRFFGPLFDLDNKTGVLVCARRFDFSPKKSVDALVADAVEVR